MTSLSGTLDVLALAQGPRAGLQKLLHLNTGVRVVGRRGGVAGLRLFRRC